MKNYLLLLSFVLLLTACSTSTQNTGYGDDGLDPNEVKGIPYGDDGLDPNEDKGY